MEPLKGGKLAHAVSLVELNRQRRTYIQWQLSVSVEEEKSL
jgi:hypothetical protein